MPVVLRLSRGQCHAAHRRMNSNVPEQNLPTVSILPRQKAEELLQHRDHTHHHTTIILTMGLPPQGTNERAYLEELSEGGEVLVVVDSKKDTRTGTKWVEAVARRTQGCPFGHQHAKIVLQSQRYQGQERVLIIVGTGDFGSSNAVHNNSMVAYLNLQSGKAQPSTCCGALVQFLHALELGEPISAASKIISRMVLTLEGCDFSHLDVVCDFVYSVPRDPTTGANALVTAVRELAATNEIQYGHSSMGGSPKSNVTHFLPTFKKLLASACLCPSENVMMVWPPAPAARRELTYCNRCYCAWNSARPSIRECKRGAGCSVVRCWFRHKSLPAGVGMRECSCIPDDANTLENFAVFLDETGSSKPTKPSHDGGVHSKFILGLNRTDGRCDVSWLYIGSANASEAAWGNALRPKNGPFNYEFGVLFKQTAAATRAATSVPWKYAEAERYSHGKMPIHPEALAASRVRLK